MKRKSLKTIKYHFIKCWVKYYRLQNISSSTAINVWIKYILYLISTATPVFEWQKCLWRRVVKQRWDERWLLRSIITREKMLMAFDGSKTIFPSLNLLDWKLHKNNFPLNKRRILNERSCGPVNNVLPFNLFFLFAFNHLLSFNQLSSCLFLSHDIKLMRLRTEGTYTIWLIIFNIPTYPKIMCTESRREADNSLKHLPEQWIHKKMLFFVSQSHNKGIKHSKQQSRRWEMPVSTLINLW